MSNFNAVSTTPGTPVNTRWRVPGGFLGLMLRAMYTSEVQQFYLRACRRYDLGTIPFVRHRHITPNLIIDYVRNSSLELMVVEVTVTAEALNRLAGKIVSVSFVRPSGSPNYAQLYNVGRAYSTVVEEPISRRFDQEFAYGTYRGFMSFSRVPVAFDPNTDYIEIYSPARYRRRWSGDKSIITDQWMYYQGDPTRLEATPKLLFTIADYDVAELVMDAYSAPASAPPADYPAGYPSNLYCAQQAYAAHQWLEIALPDILHYIDDSTFGNRIWALAYDHPEKLMPFNFTDAVITYSDLFPGHTPELP